MVKKIWNLLNLSKIMKDNQKTVVSKDKIVVKKVNNRDDKDVIFTIIDIDSDKRYYHKLMITMNNDSLNNLVKGIRVRVLTSDYMILADGILEFNDEDRDKELVLNFYSEKLAIRLEIMSINFDINDSYSITNIQQESYNCSEVLKEEKGVDLGIFNNDLAILLNNPIWSNIRLLDDITIELNKELFLLNRGNLLSDSLLKKSGKELYAILIWTLSIENHYKNAKNILVMDKKKPLTFLNSLDNVIKDWVDINSEIIIKENEIKIIKKRMEKKIEKKELDKENEKDLEIEKVKNDAKEKEEENSILKEFDEKKCVLQELKLYLMKEIVKQDNLKDKTSKLLCCVSENKALSSEILLVSLTLYKDKLDNYIDIIERDMAKIDKELMQLTNLGERAELHIKKERNDNDDNDKEIDNEKDKGDDKCKDNEKEEMDKMCKEIELLRIRKYNVFYLFIENLVETKLKKRYDEKD